MTVENQSGCYSIISVRNGGGLNQDGVGRSEGGENEVVFQVF